MARNINDNEILVYGRFDYDEVSSGSDENDDDEYGWDLVQPDVFSRDFIRRWDRIIGKLDTQLERHIRTYSQIADNNMFPADVTEDARQCLGNLEHNMGRLREAWNTISDIRAGTIFPSRDVINEALRIVALLRRGAVYDRIP